MIGAILSAVTPIVGKVVDNLFPDPEARREAKLRAMEILHEQDMTELKNAADIVEAEAKSDHWLAAAWRPLTMLTFVAIIANNYIIVPYATAFGYNLPMFDIPPDMWGLLKLGLGGYVMGRSAEKVARTIKGKGLKSILTGQNE